MKDSRLLSTVWRVITKHFASLHMPIAELLSEPTAIEVVEAPSRVPSSACTGVFHVTRRSALDRSALDALGRAVIGASAGARRF